MNALLLALLHDCYVSASSPFFSVVFTGGVKLKQVEEVAPAAEDIVREDDKPSNDLLQFLAQWSVL